MELAFSIGISVSEFWELTPYELRIAIRGFTKRKNAEAEEYKAKLKNESDLAIYQAYLISRWVWQKEVDIDKALGIEKERESKEMTDDQMLAQVKMLNRMFGGEEVENVK